IQLTHKTYAILGVMPPRFTWMGGDVYLPLKLESDQTHRYRTQIKLRPGVSMAAAEGEFRPLYQEFDRQTPNVFPKQFKISVRGLAETYTRDLKKTMVLLLGAVVILLMIGCANVSILLLARGTARQHEFAVRSSVGAGRGRLIRQLLTESVLLSVTGAALGALAAYWGVKALSTMLPYYSFPHEAEIHVNAIVLFFSAAIALMTGILFGISPAYQISKPQLGALIQASSAKLTASTHSRNTHRLLIAGQVALTLLLLAGAGGAMKTFLAKMHTPLVFDPDHVFAMNVALPKGATTTWQERINENEMIRQVVA